MSSNSAKTSAGACATVNCCSSVVDGVKSGMSSGATAAAGSIQQAARHQLGAGRWPSSTLPTRATLRLAIRLRRDAQRSSVMTDCTARTIPTYGAAADCLDMPMDPASIRQALHQIARRDHARARAVAACNACSRVAGAQLRGNLVIIKTFGEHRRHRMPPCIRMQGVGTPSTRMVQRRQTPCSVPRCVPVRSSAWTAHQVGETRARLDILYGIGATVSSTEFAAASATARGDRT